MNKLTAWGIEGIGEIVPGDQVGDIVVDACITVNRMAHCKTLT
jgi:hypothetical protein